MKLVSVNIGPTKIHWTRNFLNYHWNNVCMINLYRDGSQIENSPKGYLYSCIKPEFRLEPYLLKLTAINRVSICKLRTFNLKLPIETRRWRNIPSDERYCTLCEDQLIGNEFHYLFVCKNPTLVQMRSKYIAIYFIDVYCRTVIFHFWIDYLCMLVKHHHCFEICL